MNKLPPNWEVTTLSQIAKVEWGNTSITKKAYVKDGYIAFSASGNDGYLSHFEWKGRAIILSAIGARCGRCFLADGKWTAIKNTIVIKPYSDDIEIKFLFHFLNNDQRWSIGGSGQPFLTLGSARDVYIPIPPKNEQHRIVAKLEKLLAKVDQAQTRLEKIPGILKQFRQKILTLAFTGELSRDYRENKISNQDIGTIISSIKASRLESSTTKKQKESIARIYSYQEKKASPSLPESWKYVALDKLCASFEYGSSKKSSPSGDVPVLRMGNIQYGEIDWSDLVYTSNKEEVEKYRLKPGTVLFNRTNSPELVGKVGIYRGERPAIFAGYLIRINNCEMLDSEYLNYWLNSSFARQLCREVKTDGVSQSNINAQKLSKFEIPFCAPEEQSLIVGRIKNYFKLAEQLENRYQKAKTHIDHLTQSILAKAFRGELVPQDPNDEPASELLKRIKAEKARQEAESKPNRKPGTKKGRANKKAAV